MTADLMSDSEARTLIDGVRLEQMEGRQYEMVEYLVGSKRFSRKAAAHCVRNFLQTMRYVYEETGGLPDGPAFTPR